MDIGEKQCWVCLEAEGEDPAAEWVQPCHCRGANRWVHQRCLQRWIDERQQGNMTNKIACPLCNTDYLLVYPMLGPVAYTLDVADRIFYKTCPYLVASLVVGSVYWTAVLYGALTVMQILGHKEGLRSMERTDPFFLLVGLPTIPVLLILGKRLYWEEFVVRLFQRYSSSISNDLSINTPPPREMNFLADPISATRIFCGALAFPTFATLIGRLCFSSVNSHLRRAALGGVIFITVKGIFKIYLRSKQYYRQRQRRILNYIEHPSVEID